VRPPKCGGHLGTLRSGSNLNRMRVLRWSYGGRCRSFKGHDMRFVPSPWAAKRTSGSAAVRCRRLVVPVHVVPRGETLSWPCVRADRRERGAARQAAAPIFRGPEYHCFSHILAAGGAPISIRIPVAGPASHLDPGTPTTKPNGLRVRDEGGGRARRAAGAGGGSGAPPPPPPPFSPSGQPPGAARRSSSDVAAGRAAGRGSPVRPPPGGGGPRPRDVPWVPRGVDRRLSRLASPALL